MINCSSIDVKNSKRNILSVRTHIILIFHDKMSDDGITKKYEERGMMVDVVVWQLKNQVIALQWYGVC